MRNARKENIEWIFGFCWMRDIKEMNIQLIYQWFLLNVVCIMYTHYFSWFSHYSKHKILPFSKYLRNNFLYIIVMAFIVIFALACVNILFQYNCLLLRHITTLSSDYYRPLFIYYFISFFFLYFSIEKPFGL